MGLKFRGLIGSKNSITNAPVVAEKQNDAEGQQQGQHGGPFDKELDPTVNAAGTTTSLEDSVEEKKELQFGVQAAEATLQVWTKEHLIAAYIL